MFKAKASKAALTKKIGDAIERAFHYRTEVQLLAPAELRQIVDGNPHKAEAKKDPAHLHVHFLPKAADKQAPDRMMALAAAGEKFTVTPACAYAFYAHGAGRSKLALGIDKALGIRGTAPQLEHGDEDAGTGRGALISAFGNDSGRTRCRSRDCHRALSPNSCPREPGDTRRARPRPGPNPAGAQGPCAKDLAGAASH